MVILVRVVAIYKNNELQITHSFFWFSQVEHFRKTKNNFEKVISLSCCFDIPFCIISSVTSRSFGFNGLTPQPKRRSKIVTIS